jgi:hypothetical protein
LNKPGVYFDYYFASTVGLQNPGASQENTKVGYQLMMLSGDFNILGVFTINSNLQMGIGPVLTYIFGEAVLLPSPYINWYFGGKFLLDIQGPSHAILHYNASELLHFKLAGRFRLGTKYNISVPGQAENWNLLFSEGTLGLDTQVQLHEQFAFWVRISHTFYSWSGLLLRYRG